MSFAELKSAVSTLPPEEKGKLVSWILKTMPEASEENGYEESSKIADQRIADFEAGRGGELNHEGFWKAVEERRRK